MRLLTYTNLKSLAKGVEKGYPLKLEIVDFEVAESDIQPDFLRATLPNLEWEAVRLAADAVGLQGIPEDFQNQYLDDEDFLQAMHRLLLDINILQGSLVCPETGRKYPIVNGVPNML